MNPARMNRAIIIRRIVSGYEGISSPLRENNRAAIRNAWRAPKDTRASESQSLVIGERTKTPRLASLNTMTKRLASNPISPKIRVSAANSRT